MSIATARIMRQAEREKKGLKIRFDFPYEILMKIPMEVELKKSLARIFFLVHGPVIMNVLIVIH